MSHALRRLSWELKLWMYLQLNYVYLSLSTKLKKMALKCSICQFLVLRSKSKRLKKKGFGWRTSWVGTHCWTSPAQHSPKQTSKWRGGTVQSVLWYPSLILSCCSESLLNVIISLLESCSNVIWNENTAYSGLSCSFLTRCSHYYEKQEDQFSSIWCHASI